MSWLKPDRFFSKYLSYIITVLVINSPFKERNNNVTCEGPSTNTDGTGSTDDPMSTNSPERNPDGAIIREPPLVGFYILLTFTVLIILIGI